MTTKDFLRKLFYRIEEELKNVEKHSQALNQLEPQYVVFESLRRNPSYMYIILPPTAIRIISAVDCAFEN